MKNEKKMQSATVARAQDYQNIFNTDEGKRVLYDLIKTHHCLSTINPEKPHLAGFCEGERNVVLRILKILQFKPEKFLATIENGDQYDYLKSGQ
jgi:hypothetical protein